MGEVQYYTITQCDTLSTLPTTANILTPPAFSHYLFHTFFCFVWKLHGSGAVVNMDFFHLK